MQKKWSLLSALAALVVAACGDASITAPDAVDPSLGASPVAPAGSPPPHAESQLRVPSVRWNELARSLVAGNHTDPPMAARIYALLSVAQHDAALQARSVGGKAAHDRPSLDATVGGVVAASAEVLAYAFPNELTRIRVAEATDAAPYTGKGNQPKFFEAGRELGRAAAARVLALAKTDGAAAPWEGAIPVGPGYWSGTSPLRPNWGKVRPWLMRSGDQFRSPPPPAYDSEEFAAALAEVRAISDNRTAEQTQIALFWADGAGTATPPGHWNEIAADLIEKYRLDEERATRVFATLNMAMMDAGIACWDTKFHYWVLRPSQADPLITLPVGLPPFPSYVSGHSSFSGAAAMLLGAVFPTERATLDAMADEAALSRLYGGIHYRFDNDEGLVMGRKIGALAIQAYRAGENAGRR